MQFQSEQKEKKQRNYILGIALILLGFVFGWWVHAPKDQSLDSVSDVLRSLSVSQDEISIFETVWKTVQDEYIEQPVSSDQLIEGAIAGMVNNLSDPYTIYLSGDQTSEFLGDIQGNFEGIGAEIGIKREQLTIIAPLPDSPAEKAGIRAGDVILEINGQTTALFTLTQAVDLLRGPKDTVVEVLVKNGEEDPRSVEITRGAIEVQSVTLERRQVEDGTEYAYISISSFSDSTTQEFKTFVNDLVLDPPAGIVLDMRNNPGGYLQAGIDVASFFLEEEQIVLLEEKGSGDRSEFVSQGKHELKDFSVVVLMNSGTASAAEIVAGALRDNKGTVLVGEQSFGKGSVQDFIQLDNGGSVKITVARWLTPNGTSIDEEGLAPDITQELSTEDYDNDIDPQLDAALEQLFSAE